MAERKVDSKRLIQNRSLTPVCRVHVYGAPLYVLAQPGRWQEGSKLPISWAGKNPGSGSVDVPDAIMGKEPFVWAKNQGVSGEPIPDNWAVLDARVNRTRQWNCSSAIVHVACPLKAGEPLKRPPVRPNDVIVIEIGYTASHLTQVSRGSSAAGPYKAQTDYRKFLGDAVFYGIVDSIKERDGSGANDGVVWTIQARCPMRFLADNKIRANYRPPGIGQNGSNRVAVIRDLLYLGSLIDYVEWESDGIPQGGKITKGGTGLADTLQLRRPKQNPSHENMLKDAEVSPKNSYLTLGLLEKSTRSDVLAPEIADTLQGMRIMDKFPLDVIKHFSLVESAPRELWADPRTGNIHWMARRTDMRRLRSTDVDEAATRQYFYRHPADRANILGGTQEWSTIGTVTHFILTNPLANAQGGKGVTDLYAESPHAFLRDPHSGTPLRPMTRNRFAYDDTLTEADSPRAVLGALFEIYSRALQTGMIQVPGDPTLDIGEAVQIFNTGLFGRSSFADVPTGQQVRVNGSNYGLQQDGVFRVEAVQQLFAVGGPARGYTTVFVYGPADPDTGVFYTVTGPQDQIDKDALWLKQHPMGARVIKTQEEFDRLKGYCLTKAQLASNAPIDPLPAAPKTMVDQAGGTT